MNTNLINMIDQAKTESDIHVAESMLESYGKAIDIFANSSSDSITEFAIFQEGKIMDDVKEQGKDQSKIMKILTFIPRLIAALFKALTGKLDIVNAKGKELVEMSKEIPETAAAEIRNALESKNKDNFKKAIKTAVGVGVIGAGIGMAAVNKDKLKSFLETKLDELKAKVESFKPKKKNGTAEESSEEAPDTVITQEFIDRLRAFLKRVSEKDSFSEEETKSVIKERDDFVSELEEMKKKMVERYEEEAKDFVAVIDKYIKDLKDLFATGSDETSSSEDHAPDIENLIDKCYEDYEKFKAGIKDHDLVKCEIKDVNGTKHLVFGYINPFMFIEGLRSLAKDMYLAFDGKKSQQQDSYKKLTGFQKDYNDNLSSFADKNYKKIYSFITTEYVRRVSPIQYRNSSEQTDDRQSLSTALNELNNMKVGQVEFPDQGFAIGKMVSQIMRDIQQESVTFCNDVAKLYDEFLTLFKNIVRSGKYSEFKDKVSGENKEGDK